MFLVICCFLQTVLCFCLPGFVYQWRKEGVSYCFLFLSFTTNTWTSFMWLGCNHQIDPKDWYTLLQWGSTFLCPPPPTSWYPPCLFDLSFSIAHTHTGMKNWVCSLNREILRQEKMTECCIAACVGTTIQLPIVIISNCPLSFPILFDYGNLVFLERQRICGSCNGFGILPQQKTSILEKRSVFFMKWQYQLFFISNYDVWVIHFQFQNWTARNGKWEIIECVKKRIFQRIFGLRTIVFMLQLFQ